MYALLHMGAGNKLFVPCWADPPLALNTIN